jgi:hypothetical protein
MTASLGAQKVHIGSGVLLSEPACGPSSRRAALLAQQRYHVGNTRPCRGMSLRIRATAAEEMVADPVKKEKAQIQQLLNRCLSCCLSGFRPCFHCIRRVWWRNVFLRRGLHNLTGTLRPGPTRRVSAR